MFLLNFLGNLVPNIKIIFDINKWQDNRQKRLIEKFRLNCPHVSIKVIDEKTMTMELSVLFTSPPGTLSWICSRCGLVTHDKGTVERVTSYWKDNPVEYFKREKDMLKIYEKMRK